MPNLISFKGEDHIQAKISPKKKIIDSFWMKLNMINNKIN